jgi:pyridinium-3,5-biscarboxylic acid mononucleotide synthase
MRAEEVTELLLAVREGRMGIEDAFVTLRDLPYSDLGFARVDTHRELRQRLPEAIFAQGKTPEQVVEIAARLSSTSSGAVLATRVGGDHAQALLREFGDARYVPEARLVVVRSDPVGHLEGLVTVVAAGTSDIPVAEEAAVTAEALGAKVDRITDVGTAGLHRLLGSVERLHEADVLIVVAGMEGALASIVGGIVATPVIAVPTSVGYGASFEGLAALLAMLNSCAAGITVTNIDNGFGAAVAAIRNLNRP